MLHPGYLKKKSLKLPSTLRLFSHCIVKSEKKIKINLEEESALGATNQNKTCCF